MRGGYLFNNIKRLLSDLLLTFKVRYNDKVMIFCLWLPRFYITGVNKRNRLPHTFLSIVSIDILSRMLTANNVPISIFAVQFVFDHLPYITVSTFNTPATSFAHSPIVKRVRRSVFEIGATGYAFARTTIARDSESERPFYPGDNSPGYTWVIHFLPFYRWENFVTIVSLCRLYWRILSSGNIMQSKIVVAKKYWFLRRVRTTIDG